MQVFLRFSELQYLERLLKEGQIYCSSIQELAKKDENGIYDIYENVYKIKYIENKILELKSKDDTLKFQLNNGQLRMHTNDNFTNVFCLYTVDFTKDYTIGNEFEISPEMTGVYEYVILITKIDEFLSRIDNALDALKKAYKRSNVNYIDFSKFTGIKTEFDKPLKLKYQNEYRLAIRNTTNKPFEFFIGNIEDIARICKVSEFAIRLDRAKDIAPEI